VAEGIAAPMENASSTAGVSVWLTCRSVHPLPSRKGWDSLAPRAVWAPQEDGFAQRSTRNVFPRRLRTWAGDRTVADGV
jgi:hypothetical protein